MDGVPRLLRRGLFQNRSARRDGSDLVALPPPQQPQQPQHQQQAELRYDDLSFL